MPTERRTAILSKLATSWPAVVTTDLCKVATEVTDTTGAGIMLMSGDVPRGSVCATNDVSALIEELQFALGEGPCVDAHRSGRPVLEPDLQTSTQGRWTGFTPPAVAAGIRAVFGFPMCLGTIRLGALNLYRDAVGPLSDDQHANALVMADLSAEAVLNLQAGALEGTISAELESSADFQYVVHQATGMVAVQLETSLASAMIRLRAHAFGSGRPLRDVAEDVVAERLRLHDDPSERTDTDD